MEYIIASGPVIIENEKVLLDKDGRDSFWKFPGGKIEMSDLTDAEHSLEAAARRKVKEELDLDIEIVRPLKPMMIMKPVINDEDKNTLVVLIHWLSKRNGEVVPGGNTTEWAWHDIHNLPSDCAPNIRPVIEDYLTRTNP
ncbi:MAG: NUDIX domain-containing protein [Candidatus Uhrbacteria bacterium]|nr:NUDIX domain-containing protein [Candidatus Uhrbacteria bacterium]